MTVQIGSTYDAVIDPARVEQVLIKGVVEVKMVESLKMQMGKVTMKEMRVLQVEDIPGSFGVSHQMSALLDAEENGIAVIISACQYKLPYPTPDIEDSDAW